MTKDTYISLRRDIKNIMDIDDSTIDTIRSHKNTLLKVLDESIREAGERLGKELNVQDPREALSDIRELLEIILSGNQDFSSIRKLALRALKNGTSIYNFALLLSSILDDMKGKIQSEISGGVELFDTIKRFSLVMLLLLADEMNQAFLEAVREATGMSQTLLENYMKSTIQELINRGET